MATNLVPIPGYEGSYAIDRLGSIWSYPKKRRTFGKFLKGTLDTFGYVCLRLTDPETGKLVSKRRSRLVLETFVGPCPEGHECDHLDRNRCNDRLDNLRWLPQEANKKRFWQEFGGQSRKGTRNGRSKIDEDDVCFIRLLHGSGLSTTDIAREFSLDRTHIWQIVTYRKWNYGPSPLQC